MARDLKPLRSTKGRKQQRLNKRVTVQAVKTLHVMANAAKRRAYLAKKEEQDPEAHHAWLTRHMERQNCRCAYCGMPMFLRAPRGIAKCRATLDHVVALARGGADSEENTVAACEPCNTEKRAMDAALFRQSPFCLARRKRAETIPARPAVTLTVVVRKRR